MPKGEYRFFGIKLNPDKDGDMICFLQSKKNKQEVIKRALSLVMLEETGDIEIVKRPRGRGWIR